MIIMLLNHLLISIFIMSMGGFDLPEVSSSLTLSGVFQEFAVEHVTQMAAVFCKLFQEELY